MASDPASVALSPKVYRYRLYPNKAQAEWLSLQLSEACRLYNAALQERRDAWKTGRVRISLFVQDKQLKDIRASKDTGIVSFDVASDVLRRVDRAFSGFFRRVKLGVAPGYPRFRSVRRYDSFTYTHYGKGCSVTASERLHLQGLDSQVKIKWHRPLEGKLKRVTIKREGRAWYVMFTVRIEPIALPAVSAETGIDVGLTSLATLSDGTTIENPRWFRISQRRLRVAQRRVSRRRRGSQGRRRAVAALRAIHTRIREQRKDFHHKAARAIVNTNGLVAVEKLNVRGMARGLFGKSIHDAGWASFLNILKTKAVDAGRTFVEVDARGTSQRCPCGADVPKALHDRWHECGECGLSVPRDHASALEILRRGRRLHTETLALAGVV